MGDGVKIRYQIRGFEKLEKFLDKLPRGTIRTALSAIGEYVIGNESHGLRHDEPQKYISRKQAGYKTSPAQMRYFFAVGILENVNGTIKLNHYKRTGETAKAYNYVETNSGYGISIRNDKAAAVWTRSDTRQTTQHAMAGRRTVTKVIMDNMQGALRHAGAKIKEWLAQNK